MFIQVTEKDRKLYRKEYVAYLRRSGKRWVKLRWLFIIIGLMNFVFGIIRLMIIDEDPSRWLLYRIQGTLIIISGIGLFLLSLLQWNSPQREFKKAKAIREILDAEEAEK